MIELSTLRIDNIFKESKNHVMLHAEIPDFSTMDSMKYKSTWKSLSIKSADIEYEARGAYVNTHSCIRKPGDFSAHTVNFQEAKQDSIHYWALRNKVIYMRDSTDFEHITYLEILIHNERLSRITKEIKSLCKE